MKLTHRRGLFALLAVGWCVSFALADDLNPPPWVRGGPRTTSQEWTFDSPTDIFGHPINAPGGPYGNPYGQSTVLNPGAFVWLPDDSTFNPGNPFPRHGIVSIPGGSTLKFRIPNQEDLAFQKLVWVQLTWWAAPGTNVVVSPLATQPNSGTIIGTTPLGAGWNHTTASYVLAQQPAFEEFWIQNFGPASIYVDQLVIDTKCVPEPASLATLALGGIGLALRRRRQARQPA